MHEFSMEAGAVTVVKPRAVVTVNEYTSAEVIRGWTQTYAKAAAQVQSLLTTPESLGLGLGLFLAGQQHAPRARGRLGRMLPVLPRALATARKPCSRARPEEERGGHGFRRAPIPAPAPGSVRIRWGGDRTTRGDLCPVAVLCFLPGSGGSAFSSLVALPPRDSYRLG
jgi:hypothetical protein